jgi:hypothetical protein
MLSLTFTVAQLRGQVGAGGLTSEKHVMRIRPEVHETRWILWSAFCRAGGHRTYHTSLIGLAG